MPSGLAQILMEEAESQNVYPFRDDHTVFFRVAYSITKEAVALSTRRTNDSEIIAGVWRHRHTLSWSQNYFRVAVMTNASHKLFRLSQRFSRRNLGSSHSRVMVKSRSRP